MRFCFGILLWSLAVFAHAGELTLRGTVLEKGTRAPVFDAVVFVVDNDALSTNSDEQGRFELTLPGPGAYRLGVVAVGYDKPEPVLVTLDGATSVAEPVFYLVSNVTNPDIVVYRDRNPSRVSKTVIPGDELRSVPGTAGDPLKAIQAYPGVAVGGDASSAPAIRGSRPEDNAYYVDDLPVGYMFHMGGIISVLNGDLVDSFNLHAAAFGPEYGDVTGGVIDVALRDPRTDRIGGKLNISLIGSDALIEGPLTESQSFFFSARRSYLDLVVKQVEEEGVTFEVPEYYDYQGKYRWNVNDTHTLTAHLNGAHDQLGFVLAGDSEIGQKQPDLVGNSSFEQGYHGQAFSWLARTGEAASNKLTLSHLAERADNTLGTAGDINYSVDSWLLREQWRATLAQAHDVLLGTGAQRLAFDLDLDTKFPQCDEFTSDCDLAGATRKTYDRRVTVNVFEVYARDRWRVAPEWTLVGGLRWSYENYLRDYFTEPRVGVEWQLRDTTLLTAGWGRHHQFPSGEQVIDNFGNPDLSNFRAEHSVIGVEQTLDSWSVKVEGYYKTFDDLVVADPALNYINGASGHAYGLEALVKKAHVEKWSGWLALTLSESRRRHDLTGERIVFDYDQPVIATAVVSYRRNARWSFGGKWTYHTGTPYTPVLGPAATPYSDGRPRPEYGEVNSSRLPNYHRLDIRVDRHVVYDTWKLNFYFEAINAYNRRNVAGYDYDPTWTKRETQYQLPMIPSFGVQAEF